MNLFLIACVLFLKINSALAINDAALEKQIRKSAFEIAESLKTENPHNIDVTQFKNLIQKTQIEFSDRHADFDFTDRGQSVYRDAVNFFPGQLKIIFYRTRWRGFFDKGVDIKELLYHEYLPYFFGNDLEYIRSRDKIFSPPPKANFETIKDGDFIKELSQTENIKCLASIRFNKKTKTVSVSWIDNYLNGVKCDSSSEAIFLLCDNQEITNCVTHRREDRELLFSMKDINSFNYDWHFLKPSNAVSVGGGPFKRIDEKTPRLPITKMQGIGSYSHSTMDYASICELAFLKAEKEARRMCNLLWWDRPGECQTVDSKVVVDIFPQRYDSCSQEVWVEKKF